MDNKDTLYFYISGFISISFFAIVMLLFVNMMFEKTKIKSYALKKNNFISISLETPKIQKKAPAKKELSKVKEVESKSKQVSENIDVNELFDDVWAKKIVHTKKKVKKKDSKRLMEIQKKISKSKDKKVKSISKEIEKIDKTNNDKTTQTTSSADEVNEYLAKIQALVYKYFNVPPNSEGHSVKTVIELSALGKVIDFRVLNYSNNDALNKEVDRIKDRLKNVVFPVNPENRSTKTIVIITSKE
jgi:protein TonB